MNGKPYFASLITVMNIMDKEREGNGKLFLFERKVKIKYSQNTSGGHPLPFYSPINLMAILFESVFKID